ncbi:MAG: spore germination protein, partial [Angelakisella sp.]
GGLVIGDAAVTAGLVGLPMVILIAVTAVSSFVVPSLYEPVTLLRFTFIVIGGIMGLFGIYLGLGLLLINLCSLKTLGIPITAPVSPFDSTGMRDFIVRSGWKKLQKKTLEVDKLPGV